jgi:hypothetical protein
VKRWFKMPCLMHQRGYITLPASARGVLVTIKELLSSEPELSGNMNAYFRWTGVDRHTLKKSFEALAELGLLRIEYDEKGEITITDPTATSTKVEHELPQSSTNVVPNLAQSSTNVAPNLAQGCTKVTPNLTTQESSNDAGLEPTKTPLEENRIEENRKEKKRKEEKSAPVGAASAEPPPCVSGSLTLEEAQEIVAHYAEVRPNVIRFKDGRTGEPMTDLVWAATLLWFWDKSRAAQFGIESNPAEAPKEQPKVTIMDTRAAGKVKVERPEDCDEQVWKDWMRVRGRNALTETAWGAMLGEARKAGITPAEAVRVCAERGWRGFRADWVNRDKVSRPGRREEVDIAAIWGRKPTYEKEA